MRGWLDFFLFIYLFIYFIVNFFMEKLTEYTKYNILEQQASLVQVAQLK